MKNLVVFIKGEDKARYEPSNPTLIINIYPKKNSSSYVSRYNERMSTPAVNVNASKLINKRMMNCDILTKQNSTHTIEECAKATHKNIDKS